MFVLLIVMLLLFTALPAGGYGLGRAFPRVAVVVAGVLAGMMVLLWYCMLREGAGDEPMAVVGLGLMIWLSALPVLFVVGLASGAHGRPEWTVGVWVGTLTAAILVAWSPALSAMAPLVFIACCVAGGMWKRSHTLTPQG